MTLLVKRFYNQAFLTVLIIPSRKQDFLIMHSFDYFSGSYIVAPFIVVENEEAKMKGGIVLAEYSRVF